MPTPSTITKKIDVPKEKIRVLLEMRPALEGYAGIPQEVRLLFRGLRKIDSIDTQGLIQTSHRRLARGLKTEKIRSKKFSKASIYNRYARVIISLAEKPYRTIFDKINNRLTTKLEAFFINVTKHFGAGDLRLTHFDSKGFEDFTWRTFFSKTLPAQDFELVAGAKYRICSTPWHNLHLIGLDGLNLSDNPTYPRLNTKGIDIFIAQTPFPANVRPGTRFVVRYHDAIPILMPHTIPDKSIHQATHFYALKSNIQAGAWLACVSESTRQDLIKIFPEASERSVTIHNMVSHHYFLENSDYSRVPGIIRARLHEGDKAKGVETNPVFLTLREKENFYKRHLLSKKFKYLLIVSTVEPRKNHARLLAAWEAIKTDIDPELKLIVVGGLGWDYAQMLRSFSSWIDRGELFMLNAVPAPDLRVLYRHAEATICPSLSEGFDFSGVESMASGGITLASDIPVHREIYEDAAEYFDPYSTASLTKALYTTLYSGDGLTRRNLLREKGREVANRYVPEKILPQWEAFLKKIA